MGKKSGPPPPAGHRGHPGRHHRHHGRSPSNGSTPRPTASPRSSPTRRCSWKGGTSTSARGATTAIPRRSGRWWPTCCATASTPSPGSSSTTALPVGLAAHRARPGPHRRQVPRRLALPAHGGADQPWSPSRTCRPTPSSNGTRSTRRYIREVDEGPRLPLHPGRDCRPERQDRDGRHGRLSAETRHRHPEGGGRQPWSAT